MAKRSDFAQKLLDDLRLRKERLAASQSAAARTHSQHSRTADAYGYSKQQYRGSTQHVKGAVRTANTNIRSNSSHKSLSSGEASNQIIPFGRRHDSQRMGDLSMALAFAIENGGMLRTDSSMNASVLSFLHQISRGSKELDKMGRLDSMDRHHYLSTMQTPSFSQFHIKEISKGAQKLNQILRAWSNGVNLDRYSIEIGKELLKGAKDLEESLRVLMNLQEAPDVTTGSQRRSRLVLLDDDEEDGDIIKSTEQRQLDLLPRFSFDKPARHSRNSQQVKAIQNQALLTLTYPVEGTNFHQKEKTQSNLKSPSHKRSTSYDRNPNKTHSVHGEQKNSLASPHTKPEKGRIPNVIAKLMGLEELPQNSGSMHPPEKDKSSKQQKSAQGTTANAELKTKDVSGRSMPFIKLLLPGKDVLPNKEIPNTVLESGKKVPLRSVRPGPLSYTEKFPRTETRGKSSGGTQKVTSEINSEQRRINKWNQNYGNQKPMPEREWKKDTRMLGEKKGTEVGQTNGLFYKDELYNFPTKTQGRQEFELTTQDKVGYKAEKLSPLKRDADIHSPCGLQKPQRVIGSEQSYMLQRPESPAEKRQKMELKKQEPKNRQNGVARQTSVKPAHIEVGFQRKYSGRNQSVPQKIISSESVQFLQPKKFPNGKLHKDHDARRVKSESGKERTKMPPVIEEKSMSKAAPIQTKVTEPRKIKEGFEKRSVALHNLLKLLPEASDLEGSKQLMGEKLNCSREEEQVQTNASIHAEKTVKLIKSEASTDWMNTPREQQKEDEDLTPAHTYSTYEKFPVTKEDQSLAPFNTGGNVSLLIINERDNQSAAFEGDEEHNSTGVILDSPNCTTAETTSVSAAIQMEIPVGPEARVQEQLTESEKHLKYILMKSQLFLNTAEALFTLDIPLGLLRSGTQDSGEDNDKLVLDCSYEIMKRKGRKQELMVHPFMKTSHGVMKVQTFDSLVNQLSEQLEQLRLYGRNGNPECNVELYLPKMLEIDVNVGDPDTNCMWDFGWNETMFSFLEKDDVVRDVEKQVISGLIDEMTRDLLNV